jgi:DNA-binding NarL/FixJ family response regulator
VISVVDLCNECTKKSLCNELCPEAEAYVNQDVINQKELNIGLPTYKNLPTDLHYKTRRKLLNNFDKLPRKEQVVTLLESGMSRGEIAQLLGITRKNLRLIVHRIEEDVTLSTKCEGEETLGQETKESDQKSE